MKTSILMALVFSLASVQGLGSTTEFHCTGVGAGNKFYQLEGNLNPESITTLNVHEGIGPDSYHLKEQVIYAIETAKITPGGADLKGVATNLVFAGGGVERMIFSLPVASDEKAVLMRQTRGFENLDHDEKILLSCETQTNPEAPVYYFEK